MSTKDFTANVISATKVVPDGNFKDSKASGIWDINEALDLIKGGNWPNAANFNPAAFVDGLFQTHLYNGTGSAQTITNNIDFTKGGLIITKRRDSSTGNGPYFNDTERGVTNYVRSDDDGGTGAQSTHSTGAVVSTSNSGYVVGTFNGWNNSSGEYVSWTFREQPKFFDIVKYSGTGSNQNISHSLGSVPGMIMIKRTDSAAAWTVYHRGADGPGGSDSADYALNLGADNARDTDTQYFNDTAPTSSVFTVGTTARTNASGGTYVAYLFAHNNNDGGFGEPGDQDIIKCGVYTHPGDTSTVSVNLGFEPQWILFKADQDSANWYIFDVMRGIVTGGLSGDGDAALLVNKTEAENVNTFGIDVTSTGFDVAGNNIGSGGNNVLYMAIRRGGMQTPTAASDVFHVNTHSGNSNSNIFNAGFNPDMNITTRTGAAHNYTLSRLTGAGYLHTNETDAEVTSSGTRFWDKGNNLIDLSTNWWSQNDVVSWSWARARGYFDVVAYTGNGQNGQQIKHNLGVAPELTFIKNRGTTANWLTLFYAGELANNEGWQSTQAFEDASSYMSSSFPNQATYFGASANSNAGASSNNYIAYLFATAAGVSKVGSFTQSGATNVACGFTGDTPALIILKRTDSTGNWYIFDSARGIVAGNDKSLYLNANADQVTNADVVDPYSGGFATTSSLTNGDYIFYAIAAIS